MRPQNRTVERELARIASAQHGVVSRTQLLHAGLTVAQIKYGLRTGALLREHRGVYRVGHRAPSVEARYLAAVLACGEGALLCGRAAAHLFGVLKGPAPPPEVTTPTERRVRGLVTRRRRAADKHVATTWQGIPVTVVAQVLIDLTGVLGVEDLARACHEAGVRHGTTPAQVEALLARRPNSAGATELRSVMRGDVRVTLSELAHRFLVDEFRRYTYGDVFDDPRLMLSELGPLLAGTQ
jgi:Transcriptional regulator, AbiEi antitoxin